MFYSLLCTDVSFPAFFFLNESSIFALLSSPPFCFCKWMLMDGNEYRGSAVILRKQKRHFWFNERNVCFDKQLIRRRDRPANTCTRLQREGGNREKVWAIRVIEHHSPYGRHGNQLLTSDDDASESSSTSWCRSQKEMLRHSNTCSKTKDTILPITAKFRYLYSLTLLQYPL